MDKMPLPIFWGPDEMLPPRLWAEKATKQGQSVSGARIFPMGEWSSEEVYHPTRSAKYIRDDVVEDALRALRGLRDLAHQMNDASDEGGMLDDRYDAASTAIKKLERR